MRLTFNVDEENKIIIPEKQICMKCGRPASKRIDVRWGYVTNGLGFFRWMPLLCNVINEVFLREYKAVVPVCDRRSCLLLSSASCQWCAIIGGCVLFAIGTCWCIAEEILGPFGKPANIVVLGATFGGIVLIPVVLPALAFVRLRVVNAAKNECCVAGISSRFLSPSCAETSSCETRTQSSESSFSLLLIILGVLRFAIFAAVPVTYMFAVFILSAWIGKAWYSGLVCHLLAGITAFPVLCAALIANLVVNATNEPATDLPESSSEDKRLSLIERNAEDV